MIDIEEYRDRHIRQMKRAFNSANGESNDGDGSFKYDFILNNDDLINSYLRTMADLRYPLRVEPKRDRYVVNKQALKQALEKACEKTTKNFERQLHEYIDRDIIPYIGSQTTSLLNGITVQNNQFVAPKPQPKSFTYRFFERLSQALVEEVFNILDDTFHGR